MIVYVRSRELQLAIEFLVTIVTNWYPFGCRLVTVEMYAQ